MNRIMKIVVGLALLALSFTSLTGCVPLLVGAGGAMLVNENKGLIGDTFHQMKNGDNKYLLSQKSELDAAAQLVISNFDFKNRPVFFTQIVFDGQRIAGLNVVIARNSFVSGAPILTSAARELADLVAASLARYNRSYIRLEAHSDQSGSVQLNQTLSQQRVELIRSQLLGKNVKGDRIKATQGLGMQVPWNLAQVPSDHRRVVFYIY